jgi:hypothetical protein
MGVGVRGTGVEVGVGGTGVGVASGIYERLLTDKDLPRPIREAAMIGRISTSRDAAAGLISTVIDLAKFDAALDANSLVSAATKAPWPRHAFHAQSGVTDCAHNALTRIADARTAGVADERHDFAPLQAFNSFLGAWLDIAGGGAAMPSPRFLSSHIFGSSFSISSACSEMKTRSAF